MAIFKRGRVYWYNFTFKGRRVQKSSRQGNQNAARTMEAAHRTALAKGEVGIHDKEPAPTLSTFLQRVEAYAKGQFGNASPRTLLWYKFGLNTIRAYRPLADRKLDAITPEHLGEFSAHLQSKEWEIASVNSVLRAVRVALNLAIKWGIVPTTARVTLLRGENHRERVLSQHEEAKYLSAATEPLGSLATVLLDTGLRPEECFKLRWEQISFSTVNSRYGTLRILVGKTKAARRVLPLTSRVHNLLEALWVNAGKPEDGWIWPAPTKQKHVWHDSIRVQHKNALRDSKVTPFVIYSLRHTFLTRLGESGCDAWTLARIAGHSSIKMSERYVHPSGDAVLNAMNRMPELPLA